MREGKQTTGIGFTIITVTYQAEAVLQRTLDSVLSQDYPHVEHLIIDGASTDNTVSIANDYKEQTLQKDPGRVVKVVSERDKGLYDAMNKGLRMATGDYVLFLNAGDQLAEAGTLSLVAASCIGQDPMPAVIYGDTDVYDADGHYVGPRHLSAPDTLTWRSFRQGMLVCHQAFYALREIARRQPYDYHYHLSADVDWCIRVMREGERRGLPMRNVHAVVCHYLDGGMSIQNHRASLKERFLIMRRHYGLLSTLLWHFWFFIRQLMRRS